MAKQQRDPAKEDFWRDAVKRFAGSVLSVREFCKREQLTEPSFYAWRRKLAKRDNQDTAEPTFIPAQVVDHVAPAIVLELASGHRLQLPASLPIAQVAELVLRLEQRVSA